MVQAVTILISIVLIYFVAKKFKMSKPIYFALYMGFVFIIMLWTMD